MSEFDENPLAQPCRVLARFISDSDEFLDAEAHEVIYLVKDYDGGWSYVFRSDGKCGFFPTAFLEKIDENAESSLSSQPQIIPPTGSLDPDMLMRTISQRLPKGIPASASFQTDLSHSFHPPQSQSSAAAETVFQHDVQPPLEIPKEYRNEMGSLAIGIHDAHLYHQDSMSELEDLDLDDPSHTRIGSQPQRVVTTVERVEAHPWDSLRDSIVIMPPRLAKVCFLLNIVIPGAGTCCSGTILCFGRNKSKTHAPFCDCFAIGMNLLIGLSQLMLCLMAALVTICTAFYGLPLLLKAFDWSFSWAKHFLHLSEQYWNQPPGSYIPETIRPGMTITTIIT